MSYSSPHSQSAVLCTAAVIRTVSAVVAAFRPPVITERTDPGKRLLAAFTSVDDKALSLTTIEYQYFVVQRLSRNY